jgi:hypothetical protein
MGIFEHVHVGESFPFQRVALALLWHYKTSGSPSFIFTPSKHSLACSFNTYRAEVSAKKFPSRLFGHLIPVNNTTSL